MFINLLVFETTNQNKSAKWHCGRHTMIKKNVVNYDNLYE